MLIVVNTSKIGVHVLAKLDKYLKCPRNVPHNSANTADGSFRMTQGTRT